MTASQWIGVAAFGGLPVFFGLGLLIGHICHPTRAAATDEQQKGRDA